MSIDSWERGLCIFILHRSFKNSVRLIMFLLFHYFDSALIFKLSCMYVLANQIPYRMITLFYGNNLLPKTRVQSEDVAAPWLLPRSLLNCLA